MKITLNYDTCIASGNCGFIAPRVFQNLKEHEGFVSLICEHPPAEEWPTVHRAQHLCPSGTIFIKE
ncbi:Ferredoxin-1 [Corynebacterium faecale]|nr:Ferredoxin-1 [Corynebacterium faecale]